MPRLPSSSETDEGLDKVEAMVPEHDEAMLPEHDEVYAHEDGYAWLLRFRYLPLCPSIHFFLLFIHSLRDSEVGSPKQS